MVSAFSFWSYPRTFSPFSGLEENRLYELLSFITSVLCCHVYVFRLNLRELGPLASHMRWFIWLMAAGGTIYVFLYHEKPSDINQTHILP